MPVFPRRFDRTQAIATDVHSSVASNQRLLEQPLTLGQCLHVFTKDEKLEAFCSKCSRVGDDIVMRQQVSFHPPRTSPPSPPSRRSA